MKEEPTPETDDNEYLHTFLEEYGSESIHGAPIDWADFARCLEIERNMLKMELNEWKMLLSWGGTPEIIDQFIKGQQMRIHEAQEVETDLEAERALADLLAEALKSIWPFIEEDIPHGCNSTGYMNAIELCRANITAWKEARFE